MLLEMRAHVPNTKDARGLLNMHTQILDRKHEQMRRLYLQLVASAGKERDNHARRGSNLSNTTAVEPAPAKDSFEPHGLRE